MAQHIFLDYVADGASPCSVQLRQKGIDIGDSNVSGDMGTIFEAFKREASSHYNMVEQRDFDESELEENRRCGLCDHPIASYFVAERSPDDDLVTFHKNLGEDGVYIHWPVQLKVGSTCIKAIGVDTHNYKMYTSYFRKGTDTGYSGLHMRIDKGTNRIRIGSLLKYSDRWTMNSVVIPHSYFTMLPIEVMREMDIHVMLLNEAFPWGESRYYKHLIRSRKKYLGTSCRENVLHTVSEDLLTDPDNGELFATVISRTNAKRTFTVFNEIQSRKASNNGK